MINTSKNASFDNTRYSTSLLSRWSARILCAAALVVAFGLGAKVLTGGTGRVEFAEIEAFGSIVVNGIHYDESQANIIIDGIPNQTKANLKLGMIANIEGVLGATPNTGTASTVRVNRTMVGQIEDVNFSTGELTLLSQNVTTTATTRFDGIQSLGQLAVGNWVAINGLSDKDKRHVVATLIERIDDSTSISVLRGNVSNRNANSFRIGTLEVISSLASQPEDGKFVAIKGSYVVNAGAFNASEVSVTEEVETHEGIETKLAGYVADFRSISNFTIAGVPVNASAATFNGGRINDIKQDARVSVEGPIVNGVLQAEEIEIRSARTVPGTPSTSPAATPSTVEIEGSITAFTSMADFMVKGKRVDATNALVKNKSGAAVATGMKAHVKGRSLPDGTIAAKEIEFERL
jgi:Domain of unknown function (DUF5666)